MSERDATNGVTRRTWIRSGKAGRLDQFVFERPEHPNRVVVRAGQGAEPHHVQVVAGEHDPVAPSGTDQGAYDGKGSRCRECHAASSREHVR